MEDENGIFRSDNYTCNKTAEERPNLYYPIIQPNTGEEIWPKKTVVWRYSQETHLENERNNLVYWGKDGKGKVPAFKRYRHLLTHGGLVIPSTWWTIEDVSHTYAARKEVRAVLGSTSLVDDFINPKPEGLIQRIFEIGSKPGDIVLDSFAGSGTAGAVAHKMGRKWIMMELGEHCHTHIIPWLQKVCDGTDQCGISKNINWQGGGFKYYYMAPSLLRKDRYDQWVINEEYNATMMAAAMAKHENSRYCPDEIYYWKQGQSSEKDFIFTTTVHLTPEHLDHIHEEMQQNESLLICCKSHFTGADGKYDNITVKKIPSIAADKKGFRNE